MLNSNKYLIEEKPNQVFQRKKGLFYAYIRKWGKVFKNYSRSNAALTEAELGMNGFGHENKLAIMKFL